MQFAARLPQIILLQSTTTTRTILFFFENGLFYLKVKYYIRPLHSEDAHSRLKQGSNSSKKRNE
jgi:hypothetical protein